MSASVRNLDASTAAVSAAWAAAAAAVDARTWSRSAASTVSIARLRLSPTRRSVTTALPRSSVLRDWRTVARPAPGESDPPPAYAERAQRPRLARAAARRSWAAARSVLGGGLGGVGGVEPADGERVALQRVRGGEGGDGEGVLRLGDVRLALLDDLAQGRRVRGLGGGVVVPVCRRSHPDENEREAGQQAGDACGDRAGRGGGEGGRAGARQGARQVLVRFVVWRRSGVTRCRPFLQGVPAGRRRPHGVTQRTSCPSPVVASGAPLSQAVYDVRHITDGE